MALKNMPSTSQQFLTRIGNFFWNRPPVNYLLYYHPSQINWAALINDLIHDFWENCLIYFDRPSFALISQNSISYVTYWTVISNIDMQLFRSIVSGQKKAGTIISSVNKLVNDRLK